MRVTFDTFKVEKEAKKGEGSEKDGSSISNTISSFFQ